MNKPCALIVVVGLFLLLFCFCLRLGLLIPFVDERSGLHTAVPAAVLGSCVLASSLRGRNGESVWVRARKATVGVIVFIV